MILVFIKPINSLEPKNHQTIKPSNHQNKFGSTVFNNKSFNSLNIYGSLTFKNINIKEKLNVFGSLTGHNLKCFDLKVKGRTNIKDTKVYGTLNISGTIYCEKILVVGKTTVSGAINSSNSTFNDIEISGMKIKFNNSTIKNIFINKNSNNKDEVQKIYLKNTTVENDISFESGIGEIFIEGKSKIIGNIKGGKINKI